MEARRNQLVEQERLSAEAKRIAEERAATEAKRVAEERAAAEAMRQAQERATAEARRNQLVEQERLSAEAKRITEERAATEAKRVAEERAAVDARRKQLAEHERLSAEAKRINEERATTEAKRVVIELKVEEGRQKILDEVRELKARQEIGRLAALDQERSVFESLAVPPKLKETSHFRPTPNFRSPPSEKLILAAQTELIRIECYAGPVDGILNAKTVEAIQNYARQNELRWSGDVGDNVVDWLRKSGTGSCARKPSSVHNANKPNPQISSENCNKLSDRARIGDLNADEYQLLREACR